MTDPRNIAHDKRVKREKKHHGAVSGQAERYRPGMKPHQQPLPGRHGPDADEEMDKVESGEQH